MLNKHFVKFFVLSLLIVSGCKKDEPETETTQSGASMKATVDGVQWNAPANQVYCTIDNGMLTLSGLTIDSSLIGISVIGNFQAGASFSLDLTAGNAASFTDTTPGSAMPWSTILNPSCTGTFNITAMDTTTKRISGTFAFNAFRPSDNTFVTVQNGTFSNISYTVVGTTNQFVATVNGVTWNPPYIQGVMSSGSLLVRGVNISSGTLLDLILPDDITAGTYNLGSLGDPCYASYNPSAGTHTSSTSGSITILSHNTLSNSVSGNFHFISEHSTGTPVFNITSGSFSVYY